MALSPSELVPPVKPESAFCEAAQRAIEADIADQSAANIAYQSIVLVLGAFYNG